MGKIAGYMKHAALPPPHPAGLESQGKRVCIASLTPGPLSVSSDPSPALLIQILLNKGSDPSPPNPRLTFRDESQLSSRTPMLRV